MSYTNLTKLTLSVTISDTTYLYRTYPTYSGCSGWISSPHTLVSYNGEIYHNYAIVVPDQHVSSELEYTIQRQLWMEHEFCLSIGSE